MIPPHTRSLSTFPSFLSFSLSLSLNPCASVKAPWHILPFSILYLSPHFFIPVSPLHHFFCTSQDVVCLGHAPSNQDFIRWWTFSYPSQHSLMLPTARTHKSGEKDVLEGIYLTAHFSKVCLKNKALWFCLEECDFWQWVPWQIISLR